MRVVVCGLTTVDLIQTVERAPGPNEKASSTSAVLDVGGPAANAARAAAALGVRPVLVSPIGPGLFGRLAREWLEDAGVAVVDLAEDGDPSISAVTLDAAGNRSVVSSNNTGRRHGFPPPDVLDGAAALLVDGHLLDVQIAMARTALGLGLPVVLDGGSFKRGIAGLLPHVTHGVLSADFHLPDVDDGLLLASRHGAQSPPEYLRYVSRAVEPQRKDRRNVTRHVEPYGRQPVIDEKQLDQKRRSPKKGDVPP